MIRMLNVGQILSLIVVIAVLAASLGFTSPLFWIGLGGAAIYGLLNYLEGKQE